MSTADCVVGGFRYGVGSNEVASLLLGLYNDAGLLDHAGFTASIAKADRKAFTAKLEKLRGGAGFTGDVPGGPSRWTTERSAEWQPLRPKLVVEVCYDHVSGDRFRHGTKLLRVRIKRPANAGSHNCSARRGRRGCSRNCLARLPELLGANNVANANGHVTMPSALAMAVFSRRRFK